MKEWISSIRFAPLFVAVGTLLFSVRLFLFVREQAVNILFSDQWQTFSVLFENQTLLQAFLRQHGPHRLGAGFAVTVELMKLTDWNVNAESYFAASCLVVTTILTLLLKYRLFGTLNWWDLALSALILSPLHYETILLVPSAYHSIVPLMLLIGLELTFLAKNDLVRFGLGAVLTVMSIFTGFGVISAVFTQLFFYVNFLSRLFRRTAGSTVLPGIASLVVLCGWLVFLRGYVYNTGVGDIHPGEFSIWEYVIYVCMMFSGELQLIGVSQSWFGGIILTVGLVIVSKGLFWIGRHGLSKISPEAVSGAIFGISLSYGVLTAMGRIQIGIDYAQGSRYMALIVPAFIAVHFYLHYRYKDRLRQILLTGWAVLLLSRCPFLFETHAKVLNGFQEGKRNWIEAYLESHDIEEANSKAIFILQLATKERLDYLEQHKLSFFKTFKR